MQNLTYSLTKALGLLSRASGFKVYGSGPWFFGAALRF